MKKQSFVKGAAVLMVANAISKILGAALKIPLTYILKEEGMAIYNTAFNVYIMFLSFIISGLPFAASKLVSEYSSQGRSKMTRAVVRIASYILLILGIVGTLILFFGADFFALAMKEEKAMFAIRTVAPSVFFVAAGTAFKSYFQGVSDMTPTAASQVTEAIIKLVFGYLLSVKAVKFGIEKAAGGAICAVTIGEFAATVMLFLLYIFAKKGKSESVSKTERKEILQSIFDIALPLLFSSAAGAMLSVVETSVIRLKLIEFSGNAEEARNMFGAYTGYALTVLHLPVGILATLGTSILPIIAGSIAVGNAEKTKNAAYAAVKLTIICALPCAVGVCFMSEDILNILFRNGNSARMLSVAAPCIVFLCTGQILTAIMQSSGYIMTAFWSSFCGMILKTLMNIILVKKYGIYGAILSANICYFLVMVLNFIQVKKIIGFRYEVVDIFVKPVVGALAMSVVLWLLRGGLKMTNDVLRCTITGIWGCLVYVIFLVALRCITLEEICKTFGISKNNA